MLSVVEHDGSGSDRTPSARSSCTGFPRFSAILQYAATGVYATEGAKISVRAIPKSAELGSLEVGSTMDGKTEFEVIYLKVSVDGKVLLELDKFNFIFVVNGKDHLADVREQLGL
ncbi:phage major tail tube protein [Paenibacillus larvae]|nr:phage major tail tube protein [Paenibacillus larvae]MDT2243196.1 phage major tail tube protein [Paenibacillus larvae]